MMILGVLGITVGYCLVAIAMCHLIATTKFGGRIRHAIDQSKQRRRPSERR